MRTERSDIEVLITATLEIVIDKDQVLYELPKAYEIWNLDPFYRVYRISRKRVLRIIPKKIK